MERVLFRGTCLVSCIPVSLFVLLCSGLLSLTFCFVSLMPHLLTLTYHCSCFPPLVPCSLHPVSWLMALGSQVTAHCSQLSTHSTQLTPHCFQLTAHRSVLIGQCSLLTALNSQLSTHNSQLTALESRVSSLSFEYLGRVYRRTVKGFRQVR